VFPPATAANEYGVVGVGADLEPGTLLAAYRAGMFPMPIGRRGARIAWWSPPARGIIPLDRFHESRSLRRSRRRFEIRIDSAFEDVIAGCADRRRPHGWITRDIEAAYTRLHRLGWAHSVEAWSSADGRLAGGLYGVAIGGLFAAESKFHRETDASKAALAALVDVLRAAGADGRVLDVQWATPHLASLGAIEVPVERYLRLLRRALRLPLPAPFLSTE
jgi:leucyl/phenylalanyl-tRNA--protein transferase